VSSPIAVADGRTEGRSRRRRTALMARIFAWALFAAIGLGLALGAVAAVTRIKHVTVQSRDAALARQVSRNLRIPPWANLATSQLRRIADQAEASPRVKRAQFQRRFPDRLIVTVEPRTPCVAYEQQGRFLLVDDEGICTEWTQRPGSGLLRVKGMGFTAEPGHRMKGDWFRRSLLVARTVAAADKRRPWTLDAHYPPELAVVTGSGARGIVGNSEDLERRVNVFVEALAEYEKKGQPIGLMELRTDKPLVWTEEHRPDKTPAPQAGEESP